MYSGLQVIVDQNRKDSAKKGKRMDVRIKKRLLPLTIIKAYKGLAGILAPHAEKLYPDLLPGQDRGRRAPIRFPFMTCLRVARNIGVGRIDPQSHPRKPNIATDSGLAPFIPMLLHQTIVYPTCCMALLLRLVLVTRKPAIDNRQVLVKYRKRLMRPLLVPPWLTPYRVLDRVARMTCHPSYLTDILTIHPTTRPYHLILIHLEHSSPSSANGR